MLDDNAEMCNNIRVMFRQYFTGYHIRTGYLTPHRSRSSVMTGKGKGSGVGWGLMVPPTLIIAVDLE